MTSAAELSVLITGKDVSASKAFNDAEKSASGFGKTLGGVTKLASGFALGGGLLALPSLLGDMTKAAADDAASVSRLQKAVENSGIAWSDYSIELNEVIKGAQELGFTDDQARNSLSLLTAQTGSAEEATNRFALAMDLARGANIDVETASRLLGKVTEENVNVLARYGISVQKGASETELFGALQEKFGGQAATFANSTAGQMAQAQIAISELKEGIGTALLPVMQHAAGFLLTEFIPAAQKLVGFLQENRVAMIAFGIAAGVLVAALLPIPTAIAAIIIGGTLLINHWDEIRAKAEEVWGGLPAPIRIAADFMRDHVVARVQGVIQAFESIVEIITSVVALVKAVFHGEWATAWDELKNIANESVDLFLGLLKAQFGNLGDILYNAGVEIIEGLWGGMKDKFEDVKDWLKSVGPEIPKWKGPISVDRRLLSPTGFAIMEGLEAGMQTGFTSKVQPAIKDMTGRLTSAAESAGSAFSSAVANAVSSTPIPSMASGGGGGGASAPAGGSSFAAFGSFQHGTPYVPHDMLAYLHRGEAVVPAGRGGGSIVIDMTGSTFVGAPSSEWRQFILAAIRDAELGGGFRNVRTAVV